jgi:hypothetical protein
MIKVKIVRCRFLLNRSNSKYDGEVQPLGPISEHRMAG